jgi:hypothetical protein
MVELIYDRDCPNIAAARTNLLRAWNQMGVAAEWIEWDRGDIASPTYVQAFGSPTVLIEGCDVAGASSSENVSCCRVYRSIAGGYSGAPPMELIVAGLKTARPAPAKRRSLTRQTLLAAPGVGFSLLPKLACPACWPVYAGLLSSLGLGFLVSTAYLLPLTALFLLVAVGTLAFRARSRRGFGPFAAGSMAACLIMIGKFSLSSSPMFYSGLALLILASVWNSWPIASRCVCAPAAGELNKLECLGRIRNDEQEKSGSLQCRMRSV